MSKFQKAFDSLMEEMLNDMAKNIYASKKQDSEPEEPSEGSVLAEETIIKDAPFHVILQQFRLMFEHDVDYEPNIEYQAFRSSDPDHYITMLQGVELKDGKKIITPTLLYWEGDDCREWEPTIDDLFGLDWNLAKVTFKE